MSPFRDAVRLIYGKERYGNLLQRLKEIRHCKTFRRNIKQLYLASLSTSGRGQIPPDGSASCSYKLLLSVSPRRVNLILHQGYQRADNNCGPLHHPCRQLIAERLSAASRHYSKGIPLVEDAFYYRLLIWTECMKTKDRLQGIEYCLLHILFIVSHKVTILIVVLFK